MSINFSTCLFGKFHIKILATVRLSFSFVYHKMTIIDPPIRSTSNFYTANKNFEYKVDLSHNVELAKSCSERTTTDKELVDNRCMDSSEPHSIKVIMSYLSYSY